MFYFSLLNARMMDSAMKASTAITDKVYLLDCAKRAKIAQDITTALKVETLAQKTALIVEIVCLDTKTMFNLMAASRKGVPGSISTCPLRW